jgi:hypothetical protein
MNLFFVAVCYFQLFVVGKWGKIGEQAESSHVAKNSE